MKHDIEVVLFLVCLFFISQIVGLATVDKYIDHKAIEETGNITWAGLPYEMERPDIREEVSYVWITAAILIGTALIFLLMKFRTMMLWKTWFFLAVFITLTVAFKPWLGQGIASLAALILGYFKVFRKSVILGNLSEIFVYGGLAAIFVPLLNVNGAIMLLLLISAYDAYAVWKSKHMIKLAKFQSKSKVFAGIMIPYMRKTEINKSKGDEKINVNDAEKISVRSGRKMASKATDNVHSNIEKKDQVAVLGGGDVGFPLIFAGAVMKSMIIGEGAAYAFAKTSVIPVMTSIALFMLLYYARKGKFYPAMPFLSVGCFVGYGIILLI